MTRFAPRLAVAACAGWLIAASGTSLADPSISFKSAKTPAGISFHYRSDPRSPFAAIGFGMRDLYALTTPSKEGLVALGGAMAMQGADGAGQNEFIERLKDLAASGSYSFGAFVSQGQVRAPAATLPQAMELVAASLKRGQPTEKVLARLKAQAVSGEAQSAIRAETIAQRAALRLALGDHPLIRSLDPARFDRITGDDIGQWRRRMLDRAKLRIAASGRLGETDAARLIDRAFADLPEKLEPIAFKWPELRVPAMTVVIEHDAQQSAVVIVGQTSVGTGLEAETGSLANAVLGGSGGRLWRAVRETLGSTYGASSGLQGVGPGQRLIRLSASVSNTQVKASVDALRATYAAWHSKGVSAAELEAARGRMVNGFRSDFDDPSRANGWVLAMLLANRPLDQLTSFEARKAALTREALNTFIADRFPPAERLLTIIVTPRGEGLGADCTVRSLAEIERCRR